jgi:hypothetical protein
MLKLMRIRHRGSTSLTIVDRLSPILYWTDETIHF